LRVVERSASGPLRASSVATQTPTPARRSSGKADRVAAARRLVGHPGFALADLLDLQGQIAIERERVPRQVEMSVEDESHALGRGGSPVLDDAAAGIDRQRTRLLVGLVPVHVILKVDARADVIRNDRDALADLRRAIAVADIDLAVLFGEARYLRVGELDHMPEASLGRVVPPIAG
jgi:hypothetical protein